MDNKNLENEKESILDELNEELEQLDEVKPEEVVYEKPLTIEQLREKLNFRMQELLIIMDEYAVGNNTLSESEYEAISKEYEEIKKDLKTLKPEEKKGFWEKISVWILVYSFIQLLLCLPTIGLQFNLTILLSNYIDSHFNIVSDSAFSHFVNICIIFSFTIINLISGLFLLFGILQSKNKVNKIYFSITYGLMVIFTAISILILFL